MRKLSLIALASFLILWGINLYIIHNDDYVVPSLAQKAKPKPPLVKREVASIPDVKKVDDTPDTSLVLKENNIRNIDKIGDVINEKTVKIDEDTKVQIKKEKVKFDNEQNLKEKVSFLEQSFMDRHSTVKDIKRLQSEIQDLKNKMKMKIDNTEKWDPMFIYYLMISENYTYGEINQIQSLSENGISGEELNYINDLIKQDTFKQQVMAYKNQGDIGHVVASLKKLPKQQDEFIDGPDTGTQSAEDKLIEMNYGQDR